MSRLWDKGKPLDEQVLAYTAGEDALFDNRLVVHDVRASVAHAAMLRDQGLLAAADFAAIEAGLTALAAEHAQGLWRVELADEDVHTALERRLTERIGEAGGRVHLGRSRNDQVLAALRLWMKDEVADLAVRCPRRRRGARRSRGAPSGARAPRLHPPPAGDALVRGAVGRRLRRRARGRRAGARRVPAAHRPEPARLGRRLRHAGSRDRSRGDAPERSASRRRRLRSPPCSSPAARPRRSSCSRSTC